MLNCCYAISHARGVAPGMAISVSRYVGPLLWLKYLNSYPIGWIVMKLGIKIHGPRRMKSTDSGHPQSFPLVPPWCWHFHFFVKCLDNYWADCPGVWCIVTYINGLQKIMTLEIIFLYCLWPDPNFHSYSEISQHLPMNWHKRLYRHSWFPGDASFHDPLTSPLVQNMRLICGFQWDVLTAIHVLFRMNWNCKLFPALKWSNIIKFCGMSKAHKVM